MRNNKKTANLWNKTKQFIKHYWGYILGIVISIVLVLSLFCNFIDDNWKNILSNLGLGLFSALLLGLIIDIINNRNKSRKNQRIFEIVGQETYSTLYYLLMILHPTLSNYYKVIATGKKFEYDKLSIKNLLKVYADTIKNIKYFTTPVISTNQTITEEDRNHFRRQQEVSKLINDCKIIILDYRNKFAKIFQKINEQQTNLLINEVTSEEDIFKLKAFINLMSYQRNDLGKENELIELGKSFEEVIDCKVVDILDKIGFNKLAFTNKKGYFDAESKKGK
mgnify:CR=1 FL=1